MQLNRIRRFPITMATLLVFAMHPDGVIANGHAVINIVFCQCDFL